MKTLFFFLAIATTASGSWAADVLPTTARAEVVSQAKKPDIQIILWHAHWCGACPAARARMIEVWKKGWPVYFGDYDVDVVCRVRDRVHLLPTLVLRKDGKELDRVEGVQGIDEDKVKKWGIQYNFVPNTK